MPNLMQSLTHQFENPPDDFFMVSYRPVFFDRKSEIEFKERLLCFGWNIQDALDFCGFEVVII